jgi:hypothetical protein
MAGQLKVGGNIIASHSGVEGAGTVTLQNATLDSGVVFPAGHVIQVIYNQKTDREALSTSTGWTDIPGTDQDGNGSVFSASITPTSASNKILVSISIGGAGENFLFSTRLYRGSTPLGLSDQIGSLRTTTFMTTGSLDGFTNLEYKNHSNNFLDSPNSTVKVTYSVKVWDTRDSGTVYINRLKYDADHPEIATGTSSITLMEIQQ